MHDGRGDSMNNEMVDMIFELNARNSCPTTIDGWVWYCDEHQTHGNADSEEEAEHMSEAHVEFFEMEDSAWAAENGEDMTHKYDGCDMYVVLAKTD